MQAAATLESGDIALSGAVPVRAEYFEATGEARITLTWFSPGAHPATRRRRRPAMCGPPSTFNNADLGGAPVLVRARGRQHQLQLGHGSLAPGIVNSDFFSARWNRAVNLAGGTYRFRVAVDDAVRLFVNNALIIDQWRQQGVTEFTAEIALPRRRHPHPPGVCRLHGRRRHPPVVGIA